ncbi:MAG: hypothetical protein NTX79_04625 [Candidatus Micrarchaeota archaeon]|nr:hypothetical protein [Candidatus Micrarchaeota archaeon]
MHAVLQSKIGGRNLNPTVMIRDIESLFGKFPGCPKERVRDTYLTMLFRTYDEASPKIAKDINAVGFIYITAKKEAIEILQNEFGIPEKSEQMPEAAVVVKDKAKKRLRILAFFKNLIPSGRVGDGELASA